MAFVAKRAFVSTGKESKMYTLRLFGENNGVWGEQYVQNLSVNKEKALKKGKELSEIIGVEFEDEIDFDLKEIQRMKERGKVEIEEEEEVIVEESVVSKWEYLLSVPEYELEGQELAIFKIVKGDNIFLSGSGGVGKSWVIKQITDNQTILCAPTGIAARNIGGVTCHSLFKLPTSVVQKRHFNQGLPDETKELLKVAKRVVIDECSMIRKDILTLMEHKMRMFGDKSKPWGGWQVVMVGDFYQLPPVLKNNERQYYTPSWGRELYAFQSDAWDFETVELTKVYRQSNEAQVKALNSIRMGTDDAERALRKIQHYSEPYYKGMDKIALCTINKRADDINKRRFDLLKVNWSKSYTANTVNWSDIHPVPQHLELKVGAKVVICANSLDGEYKNGDRGVVVYMRSSTIDVVLENGDRVSVSPYKWEQYKYVNEDGSVEQQLVGRFEQLPVKLGWAISVHRSQGQSIPSAIIDIGNGCFASGQLYVALSRVEDLKKISFTDTVSPSNIIVCDEVKDFYNRERGYE